MPLGIPECRQDLLEEEREEVLRGLVSEDGKGNGIQLAREKLAFKSRKDMTSILMGCQEKRTSEERSKLIKTAVIIRATVPECLLCAKRLAVGLVWIISYSGRMPRRVLSLCLHR